ncbi:hypothetical protein [Corynebacterium sp. HMSC072A04]|uniref:hypothetical protein n=1 Tax=Corynebacterium sp. HMSC072A04 TaxID=1715045 RepID=UPI0008D370DA|nr:hypothetical protein [Corynebacterium sp. HMSC072A04]OFN34239.1 hypothetical protein HMPREF2565_10290 [Corynebacterium sp. HMSC072A04]
MKKASLALATTALAGSLCVIGSTIATADESTTNATNTSATEINFCWAPAEEFTTTIEDTEHTFKQEEFGLWRATDNEELTLDRAEVMAIAKDNAAACGKQDTAAAEIKESLAKNPPSSTTSTTTTPTTPTEKPAEPADEPSQAPTGTNESSSFDEALSSKDGEPTDLGIAAIVTAVLGVIGAIAAVAPNVAKSLGIKLPF